MSERYLPVARTLISCDSGENTRSVPAPLPELRLAIRRSPAFSGVREVPSLNCSSIEGQAGTACPSMDEQFSEGTSLTPLKAGDLLIANRSSGSGAGTLLVFSPESHEMSVLATGR